MKRLLLTILGFYIIGILTAQHQKHDYEILVSDKFINNLKSFNYKTNPQEIITEFYKILYPDSVLEWNNKTHHLPLKLEKDTTNGETIISFPYPDSVIETEISIKGILTPIVVNLDDDLESEIISIFGLDENETTFGVFKNINSHWFLIYAKNINIFYTPPELAVINNPSMNKTFYLRQLYERGSGVYLDSLHFYKLIGSKVYPCLSLINEAHIYGWGLYLNQEISMKFTSSSGLEDMLHVSYNYNFFPGAVQEGDLPWDSHAELSFVRNEKGLTYKWDSINKVYQPDYCNYQPECLNEDKIKCFGAFGNDSLFVSAFNYELNQKLANGNELIKKLISDYLNEVKYTGHALAPNFEKKEKPDTKRK